MILEVSFLVLAISTWLRSFFSLSAPSPPFVSPFSDFVGDFEVCFELIPWRCALCRRSWGVAAAGTDVGEVAGGLDMDRWDRLVQLSSPLSPSFFLRSEKDFLGD